MREFDLDSFTNALASYIAINFPYMEDEERDRKKHPNRTPLHLKDAVFNNLQFVHSIDSITFDIGSGSLEVNHPYYHILEDSETIHKRGKSTKSSRGSQDRISDKQARDYGRVEWNGKTFTQEYKKNVRGSRSKWNKATRKVYIVDSEGQVFKASVNLQADYYANIHYRYIEKGIEYAIPMLCADFGLKARRTQSTGLWEEAELQNLIDNDRDFPTNIVSALDSFMEEDYD